jgi:hypothetical protein
MENLLEDDEETDRFPNQGDPFNQGSGQDHIDADIARCLGLPGDPLYGIATYESNAYTGPYGHQTGPYAGPQVCQLHLVLPFLKK